MTLSRVRRTLWSMALCSPTLKAVGGVLQIHTGNLLEATRRIEAGSELIGERLIVNKAVGAGRADGLFVKALGIELPAFDPRDLGADQRGAVLEIVRAIRRPDFELSVMGSQSCDVLLALVGRGGVADCREGKRTVEGIFRRFHSVSRYPEQRLRPRCGIHG